MLSSRSSVENIGVENIGVENIGKSEAKLMLVHNHAEFTTVNLSEWLVGGPSSVFASNLKIPVSTFDNAPTKKVFIRTKNGKA